MRNRSIRLAVSLVVALAVSFLLVVSTGEKQTPEEIGNVSLAQAAYIHAADQFVKGGGAFCDSIQQLRPVWLTGVPHLGSGQFNRSLAGKERLGFVAVTIAFTITVAPLVAAPAQIFGDLLLYCHLQHIPGPGAYSGQSDHAFRLKVTIDSD